MPTNGLPQPAKGKSQKPAEEPPHFLTPIPRNQTLYSHFHKYKDNMAQLEATRTEFDKLSVEYYRVDKLALEYFKIQGIDSITAKKFALTGIEQQINKIRHELYTLQNSIFKDYHDIKQPHFVSIDGSENH